jgi:hypothetical protein
MRAAGGDVFAFAIGLLVARAANDLMRQLHAPFARLNDLVE